MDLAGRLLADFESAWAPSSFLMEIGFFRSGGFLEAKAMNELLGRISVDPLVGHGKACIKGTRVPVHLLLEMMAAGDSFESLRESYPFLSEDDLRAALAYAAELASEENSELKSA